MSERRGGWEGAAWSELASPATRLCIANSGVVDGTSLDEP